MVERYSDVVIVGAGIAGFWLQSSLSQAGYSCLLLERDSIGCGQTIASQGIIHSGLKYAIAGKVNTLAQNISAMPERWRAALKGHGSVNLQAARLNAPSQYLMIPDGFMGGLVKVVATKALGDSVSTLPKEDWPEHILSTGFKGSIINMGEPVLDVPSVLDAFYAQHGASMKKIPDGQSVQDFLDSHNIRAGKIIYTAAESNHPAAQDNGHGEGLETQKRPLLMGMLKNAPFELYAHLVGTTDKPVATITTHKHADGSLVWYLGGGVAERPKNDDSSAMYKDVIKALKKYMPALDLSTMDWASLPIDRIEGKSKTDGWMPDTPTLHCVDNTYYCWPTKLTFAPLLAERVLEKFSADDFSPAKEAEATDWSFLPPSSLTQTPWDRAKWTKKL